MGDERKRVKHLAWGPDSVFSPWGLILLKNSARLESHESSWDLLGPPGSAQTLDTKDGPGPLSGDSIASPRKSSSRQRTGKLLQPD